MTTGLIVLQLYLERDAPSWSQTTSSVLVSSFLLRIDPTLPWEERSGTSKNHIKAAEKRKRQSTPTCHGTDLDGLGNLVHVLGLDDGLQVILQNLGEIVLQLGASEIGEDFLPIWGSLNDQVIYTSVLAGVWFGFRFVQNNRSAFFHQATIYREHQNARHAALTHVILPQVRLLFSRQDLQRRRFANSVGAHQPQNLTGSWNWQPGRGGPKQSARMRDENLNFLKTKGRSSATVRSTT